MADISAQQFVDNWERADLKESASYVSHFEDVCRLVGHTLPHVDDPKGEKFGYQFAVRTPDGRGFADVCYKGKFAIEYKTKNKYASLSDAYKQLLQYKDDLDNPPLMVVCDIEHWEIHSNWTDTEKKVYKFTNADILKPEILQMLKDMFNAPFRLHPDRVNDKVTKAAAAKFDQIVTHMKDWETHPDRVARYLSKLVFCMFAEDADLLPTAPHSEKGVFSEILAETRHEPTRFQQYVGALFKAMADGGEFLMRPIPYFNGSLFDNVETEFLDIEALGHLYDASRLDWKAIEPSIFGTLFERSVDPAKRAQLGAHYTSRDDILLIVEPVLMEPLRREWAALRAEAAPVREGFDNAATGRVRSNRANDLERLREKMLARLRSVRVLDPACGSGNFLYVALRLLKDLEYEVIHDPLWLGRDDYPLQMPQPEVHPDQLYGMELNPIAHALASIVVWIGYIQWLGEHQLSIEKHPVLQDLSGNIRNMDAILAYDAEGKAYAPEWETADVIVGNPPFLGGNRIRGELGDKYVDDLFALYDGRVPAFADLVTYWFERAREQIEAGKVQRAGLLATNSIRGGVNREVLKRIKETGDIFMAWADRTWINEGAAVRVSMVGFDGGEETARVIDGTNTSEINADLSSTVDITQAKLLSENQGISYQGASQKGPFDIPANLAQKLLSEENPLGNLNSDVVRLVCNASDLVDRSRNMFSVYFPPNFTEQDAAEYIAPFKYLEEYAKPYRAKNNRVAYRNHWWLYGEARPGLNAALKELSRYIATPAHSKHRVFAWLDNSVVPTQALILFAREDDYFFGVLHSRLHEVWSLRMGTSLEDRPRYTPTTTFETFPFPFVPGQEDVESAAVQAISAAAKQLDAERSAWLNPAGMSEGAKKSRTLTTLYNALQVWRGNDKGKVVAAAADFAPRLDDLHRGLDAAVCAAYGWDAGVMGDEETVLRHLLALNLERGGG